MKIVQTAPNRKGQCQIAPSRALTAYHPLYQPAVPASIFTAAEDSPARGGGLAPHDPSQEASARTLGTIGPFTIAFNANQDNFAPADQTRSPPSDPALTRSHHR